MVPEDTFTTIKLHTLLGQALETVVATALVETGLEFVRSVSHSDEGSHEPDFQVRDGTGLCVLQVTNTQQAETFIKKRWRYVEQIGQTKSIEGATTPCISIVFGNRSALQRAELAMSEYLFDAVVWMRTTFESVLVERALEDLIVRRHVAPNFLRLVEKNAAVRAWLKAFARGIPKVIAQARHQVSRQPLFPVWAREHAARATRIAAVAAKVPAQPPATFLRRTFFKLSPFSESEREILISACRKPTKLQSELVNLAAFMTISLRPSIGGNYVVADEEITTTVLAGYNAKLHQSLQSVLFADNRYRNLRADIRDPNRCRVVVAKVYKTLTTKDRSRFAKMMASAFRDPSSAGFDSERVWPLDVALAASRISASEANRRYVEKFGHLGVSNPVKNFIVRTDQAMNSFSDDTRLRKFTENLSSLVIGATERELVPELELAAQLRTLRRDALFLQPYLNPTVAMFIKNVSSLGWRVDEASRDSALGLAAVPGRMKRIESLLLCRKGGRERLVKVIAAYEEGVGHKAAEMSGRRRLLGYRASNQELIIESVPETHFVYEGEWPLALLRMLFLAGWENVYSIWNLSEGDW